MDLSVITVTWNCDKHIAGQIRSVISGCRRIAYEQIVVDNASTDKTCQVVENLGVKLIRNQANKGFGTANNQAAELAQGKFFLFLNADMKVEEGSLDKIVDWLNQHKDVGIVSCKLVDESSKFNAEASPRRFPKVWEDILLILKIPHIFPSVLNHYHMKDFDPDREQEVDSVRGSFMLIRREIIEKLGWAFDPRYFIWYEDIDICREVKKMGYKVMYTPIISCVDLVGQSFKKRATYWKQKNFTRSMLTYFQKWEPGYKWIWIALLRPVGLGLAWLNDILY